MANEAPRPAPQPARGNPFEKYRRPLPVLPEFDRFDEEMTADVVIIGGGHGGTQCALAAAEGGASVIVVEAKQEDKFTYVGEQVGTFNSQFLISKGFGPYDLNEIVNEICRQSGFMANRTLINKYVKHSGEMLDHMVSLVPAGSTILDDDQCNVHEAYGKPSYPVTVGGCKSWAGTLQFRGGIRARPLPPEPGERMRNTSRLPEFEMLAVRRSQELGAVWSFGVRAQRLISENGRVVGAYGKRTKDGAIIRFNARRAVVLATGLPGNGVDLGRDVGGFVEPDVHVSTSLILPVRCFGNSSFLLLNARGERFCNESVPYGLSSAVMLQPPGHLSVVTDRKYMLQLQQNGLQHGNPDFGVPEYAEQFVEDMNEVPKHGAEGFCVRDMAFTGRGAMDRMYAADTLDELAGYLGYEGEAKKTWLASIERYNALCRAGVDDDFQKDANTLIPIDEAPFYGAVAEKPLYKDQAAHPSQPIPALYTNSDMNVVNEDFLEIPGLYAAGDCLGGRYGIYYYTPCGGNFIGTSMTLGRELGKHLASL